MVAAHPNADECRQHRDNNMSKSKQSRGKLVRKFGENIFGNVKFDRLLNRKPYGPGQHGQTRRRKPSNYSVQLRERQKIKFMYGLLEKQFRNTFEKAEKLKGETGTNMLQLLERRLDNIVYRLGISNTRSGARQLVSHKHITINEKVVNITNINAINLVKKVDIVIFDTISTGFAEAIRIGVPSLVFLNRYEYNISSNLGKKMNDEMHKKGILFFNEDVGFKYFKSLIQNLKNFKKETALTLKQFQEILAYPINTEKFHNNLDRHFNNQ